MPSGALQRAATGAPLCSNRARGPTLLPPAAGNEAQREFMSSVCRQKTRDFSKACHHWRLDIFPPSALENNSIVSTAMLAVIFGAMAVVGSVYAAIRTGNDTLLWRLTWYFADSLVIVVAGAIVRMHRLAGKSRPSVSA
jgi:hypothetical protein